MSLQLYREIKTIQEQEKADLKTVWRQQSALLSRNHTAKQWRPVLQHPPLLPKTLTNMRVMRKVVQDVAEADERAINVVFGLT